MSKTVLSYSGTGVQGQPMALAFQAAGYQTRTITRDPSSDAAQALSAGGIEVLQGDLSDPESLVAAHAGVEIVALVVPFFVPPPHTALDYMRNAVQAAEAAAVELIVWNTSGPLTPAPMQHSSVDFRHELYAVLQASSVPHIVLAPDAYMENLMGPWTAQAIRAQDTLAYPLLAGQAIGWLSVSDMAQLMVAAAGRPDMAGQVLRVNGPEKLTGPEMAARFSTALARPIAWQGLTPAQFGAQLAQVMGPQAGDVITENYTFLQQHLDAIMVYTDMTALLRELSVELTPLEAWVRQHASAFQPQSTVSDPAQ